MFLFKNCLFNVDSHGIELENLICKGSKSRQMAMELISFLSTDDIKSVILLFIKGFRELVPHVPIF